MPTTTQMTFIHTDRALIARLYGYLKPQRKYLLLGVAGAVGSSVITLLLTNVLSQIFGMFELHGSRHHLMTLLVWICVQILLLYSGKWIVSYLQAVNFAEAGQRVGLRLKNDIYTHLQSLSLAYFDRQRTGNLMSTLNNDVPVLQNGIMGIKDAVSGPITMIGGLVMIFVISAPLTCVTLLILPIIFFAIRGISHRIRAISLETQDRLADVSTLTEETLAGVRLVRSFATEQREIARFHAQTQAAKDIFMAGQRRIAALGPTTDLIGACGIAIALLYGGQQVIAHHMLAKHLVQFVALLNFIRGGVDSIGTLWVNLRQSQGAAERIFTNVLDVPTEVTEPPYAKSLILSRGEVRFENVEFAYQASRPVLRDISFAMAPGQVTAVVGPSGAGKSTLADLIPRFYDPTAGAILIDGSNIRGVQIESLRRQIGIVPQETILFNMSVRDNIAYGRPGASDEEVIAAARHANAHEFISRWPNGYETIVGDRGVQLSGGERQRVAIARAILSDPKILILDEATSSLDSTSEIQVQLALDTLMKGRTTLVIAHRLSTIVNADNILVLEAGMIVESGTHGELLRKNGAYARLYKNQFRGNAPDASLILAPPSLA